MKSETSLKPRQLTAIRLLALGTPANQVAEELDVSAMTIYRWTRQTEFQEKLNSLTSSGLAEIAKMMSAATLTAIETLQETMCDLREPTSTRMKAALGILSTTASVNGMLEKGLKHREGDFSLQERWDRGSTFDSSGNRIGVDASGECFSQLN
jgi:hypothetical protein